MTGQPRKIGLKWRHARRAADNIITKTELDVDILALKQCNFKYKKNCLEYLCSDCSKLGVSKSSWMATSVKIASHLTLSYI